MSLLARDGARRCDVPREHSFPALRLSKFDPWPRTYAAWQYIVRGWTRNDETIAQLPPEAPVRIRIELDAGVVTLRLNDETPVTVRTKFAGAVPVILIQSTEIEFEADPDHPLGAEALNPPGEPVGCRAPRVPY